MGKGWPSFSAQSVAFPCHPPIIQGAARNRCFHLKKPAGPCKSSPHLAFSWQEGIPWEKVGHPSAPNPWHSPAIFPSFKAPQEIAASLLKKSAGPCKSSPHLAFSWQEGIPWEKVGQLFMVFQYLNVLSNVLAGAPNAGAAG